MQYPTAHWRNKRSPVTSNVQTKCTTYINISTKEGSARCCIPAMALRHSGPCRQDTYKYLLTQGPPYDTCIFRWQCAAYSHQVGPAVKIALSPNVRSFCGSQPHFWRGVLLSFVTPARRRGLLRGIITTRQKDALFFSPSLRFPFASLASFAQGGWGHGKIIRLSTMA